MKHSVLRGKDLHSPSNELVENNTGTAIPKFRAVAFTSMGTAYPQVVPANGTTSLIRGLTQDVIASGGTGYITALGFLNNVDTSSWPTGTKLYATTLGVITSTPSGLPVAVVLKQDASLGIVYVENTGITKSDLESLEFPDALSLELQWTPNNPSFYTEPTYSAGIITKVDIWDSSSKTLHIFTKELTYNLDGLVTKVEITRLLDNIKLTKNLTYDVNGNVLTVTRIYTP
jgi:hypothetical protein